jgi:AraC-like DNA-binding protein
VSSSRNGAKLREWRPQSGEPGTRLVGAFAVIPKIIRQFGVDPAQVFAEAGIAPAAIARPGDRIGWEDLARLLRVSAGRTGCPHFGLLAGGEWRLSDLGLLGELARHSPTVEQALQNLVVNQHLNSEGALAFLLRRGEFADLGYAIYVPFAQSVRHIHDAALSAGMNVMRDICGDGWRPSEVFFMQPAPPDAGPYRERFQTRLSFDSSLCAIRFPASALAQPIVGAEPRRLRVAEAQAALADRGALADKVHRAVRRLLLHGKASGADIAQALAMHRRTLNRRLSAEGETFQQALDRVRLAVARELLGESALTVSEIALVLGFADSVAFIPAFRRWTGTTPGVWRRSSRQGA